MSISGTMDNSGAMVDSGAMYSSGAMLNTGAMLNSGAMYSSGAMDDCGTMLNLGAMIIGFVLDFVLFYKFQGFTEIRFFENTRINSFMMLIKVFLPVQQV